MTPRLRVFVGVLTTTLVTAVGLGLLAEGSYGWGAVVLLLGAYRGRALARQMGRLAEDQG